MALAGHLAEVKVQSSAIAMTDEATTTSDDQSYQITNTARRILDLNTAVVVEDDGVPTTESYTLNYLEGIVTFATVDAGRGVITVTGAYVTPVTVATASTFSFNGTSDVLDNTAFQATTRSYQAGLVTGTADLGRFYLTDGLFYQDLVDGSYKIIEYYVDATNKISFYGLISSDSVDSPVEGLIREDVSFQITNQIGVN